MDRGIYSSASGGILSARQLEIVGNNLANVNTVGFKAERLISREQDFSDTLASTIDKNSAKAEADQERTPGVVEVESVTDFSIGPVQVTGNRLHVALEKPNHFFVVNTPDGEAYTRAGNFTMNSEGQLSTPDGLPVLGDGGPITLGSGSARITSAGTIVDGNTTLGKLRVVEIENLESLRRAEGTRFIMDSGEAPTSVDPQLVTESVEMPNVSIVESMVQMISANRAFESYTKTLKTVNEINERAIQSAKSSG